MEYHYVVCWSEESGWYIDIESTIAKYNGHNVYVPNLDEWVFSSGDTETGDKEVELIDQLNKMFNQLDK